MKKTIEELFSILNTAQNLKSFFTRYESELTTTTFSELLHVYLKRQGLKRSAIIHKADIYERYGYEIFSGTKSPSRDKVLRLCLALSLTRQESQHLLNSAGVNGLCPRSKRDSIIIFSLYKSLDVMKCNELLLEYNQTILS